MSFSRSMSVVLTLCCSMTGTSFDLFSYVFPHHESREQKDKCDLLIRNLLPNLSSIEMTLLNPRNNDSSCTWLKVPKLTKFTGIGHATSALNSNVKIALQYSLALYSEYGPSGHSQSEREVDEFFGFGCYFHRAHSPPSNAKVIKSSWESIQSDLSQRQEISSSCSRGHTVYDLTKIDLFGNTNTRGMPNTCDYSDTNIILRKIFRETYASHNGKYIPLAMKASIVKGDLIVAVHVRRGDVLEAHVRNKRLINFNLHVQSLRSLLYAKHKFEKENNMDHKFVSIMILTEQAPNQHTVLDFNLQTGRLGKINATQQLIDVCNSFTHCRVRVLMDSEASALQTFSAFCESDVLLTTASGFSHLAAVLCRPRLVIGVPFWCSYALNPPLNIILLNDNKFDIGAETSANSTHEYSNGLRSEIFHRLAPVLLHR